MADTPDLDQMYRDLDEADKAGEHELGRRIMTKIRAAKGQQIGPAPSAIQTIGETGADIATKLGNPSGVLNVPLAMAGAAGSYLMPGQGSLRERYNREYASLNERQREASARSPMTTPAAEVAGFTLLPLSKAMGAPFTEAAASLPKTLPGAASRVLSGYLDLARWKSLSDDPSLPEPGFGTLLAGSLVPAAREAGPAMAARAEAAEAKANLHRATAAGISASDQPVVEDKLLGVTQYNPERGREAVGQLVQPFVKARETTGEVAGRMGQANEQAKRVMESARTAAEPTAKVNHTEVISEMEALRDSIFTKADMTVPERSAALAKVNEIIDRVRNHFSPRVVGISQRGVMAGPSTGEPIVGTAERIPLDQYAARPGSSQQVNIPKSAEEGGLFPRMDNRLEPTTTRPQPDTGWSPVVEEAPLSEWSKLKTLWQGIAGSKPSGKPRTSSEIETKPVLEFFEGGGGILRRAEEKAIASVLPPEQAQAFNAAKRTYGVTETLLPMAQAAARSSEPMTVLGQARHSWSPYHFLTRLGVGKIMPEESTLAGYQSGKADTMSGLSEIFGPAVKDPNYLATILAEVMRNKENRE